jgi:hypothetical protein
VLEPPRDTRVGNDERNAGRQRHELVFKRREVEQHRMPCAAEQARRLVQDPTRHADGAMNCPLGCERELERLDVEVGDGAERDPDHDLESRRRRQPGADRQRRAQLAAEPDRRPPQERELGRDARDVPPEAGRVAGAVSRERHELVELTRVKLDRGRGLGDERDSEVERHGERNATGEIGEFSDQVDAAGRPEAPGHASCEGAASFAAGSSRRCHGWNFTRRRSIR